MSASDFKMIRPLVVTDTILASTNVPEAVVPTYSGGTTYALAYRTGLAPIYGAAQLVYESLSAGNIGNPLPVPPATTTAFWKYVGSVYPPYNSGSSCNTGGIVSNISANVHLLYESLVDSNTGNPLTDTTKWLGSTTATQRPTNARAMFDPTYGSQTTAPEEIVVVLATGQIINSMFFGNVDAASVTVAQSGTGYSKTLALASHLTLGWYAWFTETPIRGYDSAITDIPPSAASTLTVTIASPGSTAACGILAVGKSVTLGKTQWELQGSILSYSGTTVNNFGGVTFLARESVKLINLEVAITPGFESEAHRLLKENSDMPIVFIGSTDYAMAMAYGYLGSWSVPISITGKTAPIEIRGLT